MSLSQHTDSECLEQRAEIGEYLLEASAQREGRLVLLTDLMLSDSRTYAELVEESGLAMSTVRHHVLRLERAGVVEVEREPGHVASILFGSVAGYCRLFIS